MSCRALFVVAGDPLYGWRESSLGALGLRLFGARPGMSAYQDGLWYRPCSAPSSDSIGINGGSSERKSRSGTRLVYGPDGAVSAGELWPMSTNRSLLSLWRSLLSCPTIWSTNAVDIG